jgi:hypothetical protein
MSDKLEEWAQEFKDSYGQQVTTRLKRQIKLNTTALIRTIKDKEIDFGSFADEVNHRIARISFLKRTLRGACIKEGYKAEHPDEQKAIPSFLEKYDSSRSIRLRKLKGILLRKISKYSS